MKCGIVCVDADGAAFYSDDNISRKKCCLLRKTRKIWLQLCDNSIEGHVYRTTIKVNKFMIRESGKFLRCSLTNSANIE